MTLSHPLDEKDAFEAWLCGTYTLGDPVWACRLSHTLKPQHSPPLGLHIGRIPRQPIPSCWGFHFSRKAYSILR
jgi:hypothetical protein